MSKLISIIVATVGVVCSIFFIIINIFKHYMSIPISLVIAVGFDILLIMYSLMINMMSVIVSRLSRLTRNLTDKEDKE